MAYPKSPSAILLLAFYQWSSAEKNVITHAFEVLVGVFLKQAIESIKENPLAKLKQKGIPLTAWRKNMAKKDRVYANIMGYVA